VVVWVWWVWWRGECEELWMSMWVVNWVSVVCADFNCEGLLLGALAKAKNEPSILLSCSVVVY
jgi:hypothetical protein